MQMVTPYFILTPQQPDPVDIGSLLTPQSGPRMAVACVPEPVTFYGYRALAPGPSVSWVVDK